MPKDRNFRKSMNRFSKLIGAGQFTDQTDAAIGTDDAILEVVEHLKQVRANNGRVYLLGNGGSAAIASHILIDLRNIGKICAMTLDEPTVMTCYTNDYGYEQAFSYQIDAFANERDFVIAISSSGYSKNIINAVNMAQKKSIASLTLSGFSSENELRQLGNWNYWLNDKHYGMVEVGHLFLLHHIIDILGKK